MLHTVCKGEINLMVVIFDIKVQNKRNELFSNSL